MEGMCRLLLFNAVTNLMYLFSFQPSYGNELNISLHHSNIYNLSVRDEVISLPQVVHLLKCPGSVTRSGRQIISTDFFEKYGFKDQIDQNPNYTLIARITENEPECTADSVFTSVQSPDLNNDTEYQGHAMLLHGWILKYYSPDYWESIPPNRYCITAGLDDEHEFSIKYCQSDCKTQSCIPKCCFANEVCAVTGSDEYCQCIDSGRNKWTTTVEHYLEMRYSFVHYLYQSCGSVHFTLHQNSTIVNSSYQNDFKILKNGSVNFYRISDGNWITLPEGTYCVDGAAVPDPNGGEGANFSGQASDMVLHLCRSLDDISPTEEQQRQQFILYTILVPFAAMFVLLTIVVYILTWQEQNVYGHTNFLYLATLLALYVFIVLGNIRDIAYPNKHPTLCAFLGGAIHFSYLSSACWVTCISFDVWRTFKHMNRVTRQSRGRRRFVMFCIFSIGYPLIQVSLCVLLDTIYSDSAAGIVPFILPKYGRFSCNMSNDGVTYYLYIPITVLLLCNIGFFIATIVAMIHYKKSIREAFAEISNSVNPSKANQSFGIYTRLFIIMGIFWISQIISWFVMLKESSTDRTLEIFFAITDALTVLQAVAIFYIFVCKRRVFAKLWTLHPWLRPFLILWVKNGCCSIPSYPSRERNVVMKCNSGRGRRTSGLLRDATEDNTQTQRDSSNSSIGIPAGTIVAPENNENLKRQSSLASDDGSCTTTVSVLDEGNKFESKDAEHELDVKSSETSL